jgi:hypothetical protein
VHFDCLFHGAEVEGDLLIQLAGDDLLEHFALARGEACDTGADVVQFDACLTRVAIVLQRTANCREQVDVFHWLGEKVGGAALHRLHAHRHVRAAREEDDRQHAASRGEGLLKFETVETGHRHVEHQTARLGRGVRIEKFAGGSKCRRTLKVYQQRSK